MASNIQRGTRGLSAGDWVRLKRLNGARTFTTDVTTNPEPHIEVNSARRVYTEFGTSKIRRPASNWTEFVASQTADYVLETPSGSCGVGKALTVHKVCTCKTTSAIKHTVCMICK
jgi:hypothetical protein